MYHYYGPGMGLGLGTFFFGLLSAAFWVLLIWALVVFVFGRHRHGHYHDRHHADTNPEPLEIAKARYAKGEITKTEFEDIKKNIAS